MPPPHPRPDAVGAPLVAVCYGTRPQVIKASVLVDALRARWRVHTVDTGQHYDYELNALLYEQLGVTRPDVTLEVGSGDHATQTAAVLTRAADVLVRERPRAVVVIGDTNSTLGCTLAAAKMRVPVVHVEAGLRAGDAMMAEELNRRLVDAASALLCAPSAAAEQRLRDERVAGAIRRTGDIAHDVLRQNIRRAPTANGNGWPLPAGAPFVFATLHRAELTDDETALAGVIAALGRLPLPVVFAAHPRTRRVLEQAGLLGRLPATVHLLPPLGYLETLASVRDARAVVTDSGGVQREAYWLGTPCVTVREETEWSETVVAGANALVPPRRAGDELPGAVAAQVDRGRTPWDRAAYGAGDAASRIAAAIAELLD